MTDKRHDLESFYLWIYNEEGRTVTLHMVKGEDLEMKKLPCIIQLSPG